MSIRVTCDRCGTSFLVADDRAGQVGKCTCGNLIKVPAAPAPPAAEAPAAPPQGAPPPAAPPADVIQAPPPPAPAAPVPDRDHMTPLGGPASRPPATAAPSQAPAAPWGEPPVARPMTRPPEDEPGVVGTGTGQLPNSDADLALILAIVSVVLSCLGFGIILGPLAIWKAEAARKAYQAHPGMGGAGKATAARIIGYIVTGLWLLSVLAWFFLRAAISHLPQPPPMPIR